MRKEMDYKDENIWLMQGDCLERMKEIQDGSVDMILCDLPYGTTKCSWDSVIPFEPLWEQLHRITKERGAIVLFGSEPFSSALRMSNIKRYRYDWVWEKPQGVDPLLSKKRPLNNIENVIVFYKKLPIYNPQFESGSPYSVTRDRKSRVCEINGHEFKETTTENKGYRYPKRVLKFNREVGLHPTQKPVALMEYLIKTYTNEGDTVLDFTSGSVTTGVAAANTGRKGIMIEKDPHYYKIGYERVKEALSKKEILGSQ